MFISAVFKKNYYSTKLKQDM